MGDEISSINTLNDDPRRVLRWPKWRTWKRIFLALLIIVVVGDIYLHFWAAQWVEERLAQNPGDPQKVAQLKEFWKKPIHVPKEWANLKPPSQALIDVFKEVNQAKGNFESKEPTTRFRINKAYKETSVLSNEQDRSQYLEDIAKMEPYLAAIQKLSGLMTQEAKSVSSCYELSYLPISWGLFPAREAMKQKALALVAAGKYGESVDCYLSILPLLLVNPTCEFTDYWIKFRVLQEIIPEMEMALPQIHHVDRLRSWLETLQWAAPFLCVDIGDRMNEYEVLESYWMFTKKSPLDLKSNLIAGDIIRESARNYIHNFHQPGPLFGVIDVIVMSLSDYKPANELMEIRVAGDLDSLIFTDVLTEFMMLRIFNPGQPQRMKDYESQGTLMYDALRLRVAARLYELETGKKVTVTGDLVPNYLPQEIWLRKSGKPFAWDANGNVIVPAFQ